MTPDVSVILPYRDVAATLGEALRSILEERDVRFEVLAIDDGSVDGSDAVAELRDPRVRRLRTGGSGLVAALEAGRAEARAPLLMRMDGDDVSLPGRMGAQCAALDDARLVVVGGRVVAFPDEAVGEGLRRYVAWQNALLRPEDHARDVFVEATLCHPSVMLRASALQAIGGYRSGPFAEDWDLWLRLDAAGLGVAKVDAEVLRWRHRAGRATFSDPRYGEAAHRRLRAMHLGPRLIAEREAGRRLVSWGAGPIARRMARELEERGVRFERFVEIDPRLVGRSRRGAPIIAPSALEPVDFVVSLVGARGARDLIRAELRQMGRRERVDFICAA